MDQRELHLAVEALQAGGVVIFPTDTVYGIGASLQRPDAIRRLYELKQRPLDQPTAVLISAINQLQLVSDQQLSDLQGIILKSFWPGSLTVVVQTSKQTVYSAGLSLICGKQAEYIGVRVPNHAIALRLIDQLGCPLVTSSANIKGEPPPSQLDEVDARLKAQATVCLAGKVLSQIPSTIIALGDNRFEILREGEITADDLEQASRRAC